MHGRCLTVNALLTVVLVDVQGLRLVPAQHVVTLVVARLPFALSYAWVDTLTPIGPEPPGTG